MTDEPLTLTKSDERALISVAGELDGETAPGVREAALEMIAERAAAGAVPGLPLFDPCVLDLSGVSFAGSYAVAVMLELDARARASHLGLTYVVTPESALARLLDRTGVDTQLTIQPTLAEATPGPNGPAQGISRW